MTIDDYLDELMGRLRGRPGDVRRTLTEAEAHLRDAADAEVEAGATPEEAEARAVARFGTSRQVAHAANATTVALIGPLVATGARLAVVGFAAIGGAALAARLLALVSSTNAVFGIPGSANRPGAADHWLSVHPDAPGWRAAAAMENADDILVLRMAFAIVGLVAAVVVVAVTRRWRPLRGIEPVIGMTAFGGAGLAALAGGLVNAYTPFEWGQGLWLVDACVALAIAAAYVVAFVRDQRRVLA